MTVLTRLNLASIYGRNIIVIFFRLNLDIFDKSTHLITKNTIMCMRILCYSFLMGAEILNRINDELLRLQFCPKLIGHKYIRDCVAILLGSHGIFNLKREVFPKIAEKYGVTIKSIDKSISTVIEKSLLNVNTELLEEELGYLISEDKGKPTVKQFIMYLYERIEQGSLRL